MPMEIRDDINSLARLIITKTDRPDFRRADPECKLWLATRHLAHAIHDLMDGKNGAHWLHDANGSYPKAVAYLREEARAARLEELTTRELELEDELAAVRAEQALEDCD